MNGNRMLWKSLRRADSGGPKLGTYAEDQGYGGDKSALENPRPSSSEVRRTLVLEIESHRTVGKIPRMELEKRLRKTTDIHDLTRWEIKREV
jgi:hypothetical protein